MPPVKCFDLNSLFYASAGFNIVADALLLAFIIPRIRIYAQSPPYYKLF